LEFLFEALIKGEPEGYVRTLVDEGKLLKPLLRKALAKGVTPEYTAGLLHAIETEERLKSGGGVATTAHTSNLLSERETEILHLIETGLSNRQIADRLVIALATTKTHIHNLCRKLNASTRTQALARAKEQKLI
jgi:LuxR family maltose regulon positive regulatory protein